MIPNTSREIAFRWAIIVGFALAWFGISAFVPAVGAMLVVLHSIFFLGDVGMNGWQGAEYAPLNLGGLICALAGVMVAGG